MTRIAFLGYPEPDGVHFGNGVARVIFNMAKAFRERGDIVIFYHLFSLEQYSGLNVFLINNQIDIAIWHMTSLKIKRPFNPPCPLICLWHSTPFFQSNLTDFLDKHKIKPKFSKLLNNCLFNHLYSITHSIYNSLAFSYITAHADRMVLLSETFFKGFIPSKIYPHKVIAIPNFLSEIDIEASHKSYDKKKEVLFVGRVGSKSKRIDLLLKIWAIVEREEQLRDWQLNICGGNNETAIELSNTIGLERVHFMGHVNPEDYYQTGSVFCMTSSYEGFPMVLLEAAARGCVLISFNSFESAADIIEDGKNGIIINNGDINSYARELINLMKNDETRVTMAAEAQRSVSRFSSEAIMNRWQELIDEVCKNKPKA